MFYSWVVESQTQHTVNVPPKGLGVQVPPQEQTHLSVANLFFTQDKCMKRIWTDEQILKLSDNATSITEILRLLGLSEKSGSSHKAIKNRLLQLGIDKFQDVEVWNKGKTKETHPAIRKGGETMSKRYASGEVIGWSKGLTKETDPRLAAISEHNKKVVNKKIEEGTWHVSFSKRKTYEYKGEKFHGTWELKYAQWLDSQNIRWRKPKENFHYELNGTSHRYTPDFYLIDEMCYVEIKGYETEKDRAKWDQFPLKLKVLKGKELNELGLIDSYKNLTKKN